MRIFLTILLALSVFPSGVNGLREIKRGEKLPTVNEMQFIKKKGKSVLMYIKSDDLKSVTFLRQFLKVYEKGIKVKFYLIDMNMETDKRVVTIFEKIKVRKESLMIRIGRYSVV